MTVRKRPEPQPPGDDTALFVAALNHAWAWYDARVSRGLQVINYFLLASAVLANAYVSAINGKHYSLAALVALTGIALAAITALIQFRNRVGLKFGGPVLAELQGQVADRLKIDMTGMIGTQSWTTWQGRIARSNVMAVAFGLAVVVNGCALVYAVIH